VTAYEGLLTDVVGVIDEARCATALSVNAAMTRTYWFIRPRHPDFARLGIGDPDCLSLLTFDPRRLGGYAPSGLSSARSGAGIESARHRGARMRRPD
jgi:hypothetical protein